MKHITTAAALLALVSAPALGNPLCTNSESSCITVNGTIGGVTFIAAPGNALEVSSSGFQGTAAYNPAMGSSDTGVAVFGPMDFTTTGSLMTPPPAGLDPPLPLPLPRLPRTFPHPDRYPPSHSPTKRLTIQTTLPWV